MSQRRRSLIRFSILALCVAVVIWMITRLGPRKVLEVAREADPLWLALSLLPVAGRFLIWGVKWSLMLRSQGRISFRVAVQTLLAGAFVNLTTPTAKLAGGLVRAALVHRHTSWGMTVAYGWVLADQVTNVLGNLALISLLALGAALILPPDGAGWSFLASGLVAAAIVLAAISLRGAAWRLVRRPAVASWFARFTPARLGNHQSHVSQGTWIETVFKPLLRTRSIRSGFPIDLGLAACSFGSLCLANAMVLRALGVHAPLLLVAAAVALGYFAGTLLGTMGGIGATELALIELYTLIGIPRAAATAGALLHRAGFYLLTLIWGGLALWWLSRRPERERRYR